MASALTGIYTYDYPIDTVHRYIVNYFKEQYRSLPLLRQRLLAFEQQLEYGQNSFDYNTKQSIVVNIEELKYEIDIINTKKNVSQYMKQARPLLDNYLKLGKLRIDCQTNLLLCSNSDIEYRLSIIEKYLKVAKQIINHDIIRREEVINICEECGDDINQLTVDAFGIIKCQCGIVYSTMSNTPSYSRTGVSSSSSNSDYQSEINFIRAYECYQGIQPINRHPKPEVYIQVENYLSTYLNYPPSSNIRNLPLNVDGEKDGTRREDMYTALDQTGNSRHYKDINLMCNRLWGWSLDDISLLYPSLIYDFKISEPIYNQIKIKYGRRSSMNSQLRLYLHLLKLGHPCDYRKFKIPDTDNIINELMKIWSEMCQILGWESHPMQQDIYSSTDSSYTDYLPLLNLNAKSTNVTTGTKIKWPENRPRSPLKNDDA